MLNASDQRKRWLILKLYISMKTKEGEIGTTQLVVESLIQKQCEEDLSNECVLNHHHDDNNNDHIQHKSTGLTSWLDVRDRDITSKRERGRDLVEKLALVLSWFWLLKTVRGCEQT